MSRRRGAALGLAAAIVAGACGGGPEDSAAKSTSSTTTTSAAAGTSARAPLRELRPTTATNVGIHPLGIEAAAGAVWVSGNGAGPEVVAPALRRVDPGNGAVTTVDLGVPPRPWDPERPSLANLTTGEGSLWVATPGRVLRVDPVTQRVTATFRTPDRDPCCLAVGGGAVWVIVFGDDDHRALLARVDISTGAVVELPAPQGLTNLTADDTGAWVADFDANVVVHHDAATGAVRARVPVDAAPALLDAGDRAVWVTSRKEGTVQRIDPSSEKVVATIELNVSPDFDDSVESLGVTSAGDDVFVTSRRISDDATVLTRVDAKTNRVVWARRIGRGNAIRMAVAAGSVWTFDPFSFDATGGPDRLLRLPIDG